jgi:chromosomal replication initiation ATPase DnaA
LDRAAARFGVTIQAMLSPCRTDRLAQARFAAMLALHRQGYSYSGIARATRRKDHTTCVHGVRRALELEANYPPFADLMRELYAVPGFGGEG